VGLILMAAVVLSALAVPAASAGTLASPSERSSGSQLGANKAGGWGCSQYYVVRRGDNLTRIAYRYGTTVNALMNCNNIWNPDRIYAGQRLCICSPYCRPPAPPKPPKPPPCPQPCAQPCPQPCAQPCPQPCAQPCPQPCAQPCPPQPQPGYWLGQYYNNMDLGGTPVLQTSTPNLCFNWGWGSPGPQVSSDGFSARYTAPIYMQGGTWRVSVTSDDGVRVYVDDVLLLDAWTIQSATTYNRDVVVPTGSHTFVVEYFENDQLAQLCVTITKW